MATSHFMNKSMITLLAWHSSRSYDGTDPIPRAQISVKDVYYITRITPDHLRPYTLVTITTDRG